MIGQSDFLVISFYRLYVGVPVLLQRRGQVGVLTQFFGSGEAIHDYVQQLQYYREVTYRVDDVDKWCSIDGVLQGPRVRHAGLNRLRGRCLWNGSGVTKERQTRAER